VKLPPWGLRGGGDGALGEYLLRHRDGGTERLPSKCTVHLRDGDTVVIRTPGGGGYGDSFNREPASVLRDVVNGLVSVEAAMREYGVVVNPESLQVRVEATKRARRRKNR